MNYYQASSTGDLFTVIEHQEKIAAQKVGINKLDDYIDWELFREELEDILGYSKRDSKKGGRGIGRADTGGYRQTGDGVKDFRKGGSDSRHVDGFV